MCSRKYRINLQAVIRVTELADYIVPFAIRVACELRIADLLADGSRSVTDLAEESGAHAPSLHRLLRALASKGIFTEGTAGEFGLTPLAEPLTSDHPLSVREAFPMLPGEIRAWSHLGHTIRTGNAAFDDVHGQSCWDYLSDHPDEDARWLASQQAATALEARTVLSAYPWDRFGTVADLGGGHGAFLTALLARFPGMHGILLDLAHAADAAAPVLEEAGVADRCSVVTGDMLTGVPPGADAYVLKRVLYGLDDEKAAQALGQVHAAMPPESRLLVVEPVVEAGNSEDVGKLYDLLLLTMTGVGARTREQLESLCTTAGLRVHEFIPTPMLTIAEIVPQ